MPIIWGLFFLYALKLLFSITFTQSPKWKNDSIPFMLLWFLAWTLPLSSSLSIYIIPLVFYHYIYCLFSLNSRFKINNGFVYKNYYYHDHHLSPHSSNPWLNNLFIESSIVLCSLHVQLCLYHLVSYIYSHMLINFVTHPILYTLPLDSIYKSTYDLLVLRVWSSLVVQSTITHQSMWLKYSLVPCPLRPFVSPGSYSCKWLKYWFTRLNFLSSSLYGIAIMGWLSSLFLDSFHPNHDICSPLWILLESYKWLTH